LKPGPGQQFAINIWEINEEFKRINVNLHIEWVPGHCEVKGNEIADELAKEGAKEGSIANKSSPYTSIAFLKRRVKELCLIEWNNQWQKNKKGKSYMGTPNLRRPKPLDLLPRNMTSTIVQLRTGHGYFNSYLVRIPSSGILLERCNCSPNPQTPKHLILECKFYSQQRKKLREDLKGLPLYLSTILYASRGIKALAGYISNTQIATRPNSSENPGYNRRVGWGRLED